MPPGNIVFDTIYENYHDNSTYTFGCLQINIQI
jgi:hypothetical protein